MSYIRTAKAFLDGGPAQSGALKSAGTPKHCVLSFYVWGIWAGATATIGEQVIAVVGEAYPGGHRVLHVRADLNRVWGGTARDRSTTYILNKVAAEAKERDIPIRVMGKGCIDIGVLNGPAHKAWKRKNRVASAAILAARLEKQQQRELEESLKQARAASPVYSYDEAVGF